MKALREWLDKPLGQLLLAVIALVAIFLAWDGVRNAEKRARAAEQQTTKLKEMAAEFTRLHAVTGDLEKGIAGGEDVIQTAHQLAAENNLTLAGAQTGTSEPQGDFQDKTYTLRFRQVPLKPLIGFMNALEARRSGVEVRELRIVHSIENPKLLDATLLTAQLTPQNQ